MIVTEPARPSVGWLLDQATRRLAAVSDSPRLDAQVLLAEASGLARAAQLMHPERSLGAGEAMAFERLVQRRELGEPTAYVLRWREFYGRRFAVDRRVLIPRPETEDLVALGIEAVRRWQAIGVAPRVVDVGTGSGAIAATVALESGMPATATDLSAGALEVAGTNARALGAKVDLLRTDLVAGLRGPVHVLLANLPYIPRGRALPRDVADHEPSLALFGGDRGSELLERLLLEAPSILAPGATVVLELDDGQGDELSRLARHCYPRAVVELRRDFAGLERLLLVRTAPESS